jgi:hypothetical protein
VSVQCVWNERWKLNPVPSSKVVTELTTPRNKAWVRHGTRNFVTPCDHGQFVLSRGGLYALKMDVPKPEPDQAYHYSPNLHCCVTISVTSRPMLRISILLPHKFYGWIWEFTYNNSWKSSENWRLLPLILLLEITLVTVSVDGFRHLLATLGSNNNIAFSTKRGETQSVRPELFVWQGLGVRKAPLTNDHEKCEIVFQFPKP